MYKTRKLYLFNKIFISFGKSFFYILLHPKNPLTYFKNPYFPYIQDYFSLKNLSFPFNHFYILPHP
jgi:hypothetical protein